MEPKLYAVLLGGRAPGCHIELHDVVFAVGESIEDTHQKLPSKWFGSNKRLHIDSYVELDVVDNYKVVLTKDKPAQPSALKLFFINFGGYRPNHFGEVHERAFYVGENKNAALKRARHELCVGTYLQHRDDFLEVNNQVENLRQDVDDVFEVGALDGYYIDLQPTHESKELKIVSDYVRIKEPELA